MLVDHNKSVHLLTLIDYQRQFIESQKKIVALIGGTGCGKTFLLPIILLYKSRLLYQSNQEKVEIIVMAPTYKMLLRNPLKYILRHFNEIGLEYKLNKSEMTIIFAYGIIYLISGESYESMQGIHADLVIMDEAGLMSKPVLDTALQRVAFKNGQLLILSTPYSANHWLKTEVYDEHLKSNPNIDVFNPRSSENPFYPLSEIERARKVLPAWKFTMFFEARFTRPAGLVFESVEYIEPFKLPQGYSYFRGLDFGFNNPNAVVQLAIDPNSETVYVIGEWKQSKTNIDDLEQVLKKGRGVAYADPAGKDALETLRARGIPLVEAKKNVIAGISMLDGMFRAKKLLVFDNLHMLKDELSTYTWMVDKSERLLDRPTKENDHLIDALRYAIFTYENGYRFKKFMDSWMSLNDRVGHVGW